MNSLKSILTAIAFVFAIGAAFAFATDNASTTVRLKPVNGSCETQDRAITLPQGCALQPGNICTIVDFGVTKEIFQAGSCVTPYAKQP